MRFDLIEFIEPGAYRLVGDYMFAGAKRLDDQGASPGEIIAHCNNVAPDSFKGSLSSVEVARALAAGWSRARPRDDLALAPLADGGEGTLDAIEAAGGWERRQRSRHSYGCTVISGFQTQ